MGHFLFVILFLIICAQGWRLERLSRRVALLERASSTSNGTAVSDARS
mgnify:CR=1 FL=1